MVGLDRNWPIIRPVGQPGPDRRYQPCFRRPELRSGNDRRVSESSGNWNFCGWEHNGMTVGGGRGAGHERIVLDYAALTDFALLGLRGDNRQPGWPQDRRQNAPGEFDFYVLSLPWSLLTCEAASERGHSNRGIQAQCGAAIFLSGARPVAAVRARFSRITASVPPRASTVTSLSRCSMTVAKRHHTPPHPLHARDVQSAFVILSVSRIWLRLRPSRWREIEAAFIKANLGL